MNREKEGKRIAPPMPQINTYPVYTDPFGSYTGVVLDPEDDPVQDADDL